MAKDKQDRRAFLGRATTAAMVSSLALGYGGCGAMGVRFLYPARPLARRWQFVALLADLASGDSTTYESPTGESIAIARRGETGESDDFIALSSTCPHLGCQVHWEGHNDRFFCPCHNGVFNPDGEPVDGPPADAGQSLPRYPVKVENGMLFLLVPVEGLQG